MKGMGQTNPKIVFTKTKIWYANFELHDPENLGAGKQIIVTQKVPSRLSQNIVEFVKLDEVRKLIQAALSLTKDLQDPTKLEVLKFRLSLWD